MAAKNAYSNSNVLYEKAFFVILLMMIMHLEFRGKWSGKSGNSVVANEWEPWISAMLVGK